MIKLTYPDLWKGCIGAWCPSVDIARGSSKLSDRSRFGNHGTLTLMDPVTDWVVSGGKGALDFDGTNDYVDCGRGGSGIGTGNLTVSYWVRSTSTATYSYHVHKANALMSGTGLGWACGNQGLAAGSFIGGLMDATSIFQVRSASLNILHDGLWHHVLMSITRASTTTCFLYIDGIDRTTTRTGTMPTGTIETSQNMWLMRLYNGGPSTAFSGNIDDVRVYNRAIQLPEARTLSLRRGIAYETQRRRVFKGAGGGGSHSLTANSISTGAPTVDTPTVTQFHSLLAVGIATGAPTLETPTITQAGQLTAVGIATGAPTLGTPTLSQFHSLTATTIVTGAPTLDTPSISLAGQLTATPIATGAPTLGTPTLTQSHVLSAVNIATGAPTLDTPTISLAGQLTAVGIATGAPTLGSPAMLQRHQLSAIGIVTGAPTLGTPTIAGPGSGPGLIVGPEWVIAW